ncbi:hypothetical protein PENTCL1PPCAC_25329, partial [Pristionchus entomophagus]
ASSDTHCVESPDGWTLLADLAIVKCDQQFSLILTEELPRLIMPLKQPSMYTLKDRTLIAVPQTGTWIHTTNCVGKGTVTISTGAGPNVNDREVTYRSWPCKSLPDWIFSFDIVITIDANDVVLDMECSSDKSPITALHGDSVTIITSGIS